MKDVINFEEILIQLKANPAFERVPEEQLEWLIDKSEFRETEAGEQILSKGDPIDHMIIVLSGIVSFRGERNGQFLELSRFRKDDITGALPYSRGKKSAIVAVAIKESKLLMLNKIHFNEMIRTQYELVEALVHIMTTRVREYTRQTMQQEKLMSLGKISAGLAHELNNPSSAVVRAASELKRHLIAAPEKFKQIIQMRLTGEQIDHINNMLFLRIKDLEKKQMGLLERTECEDEIIAWLEEHNVSDFDDMAPTFVEFGLTFEDFDEILNIVGEEFLPAILKWVDSTLTTEKLLIEIEEASRRINHLVASIKEYSHMDQAPDKQPTNIRKGIESTLTMLNHRLKRKNIKVELNLDNIPEISGYAGELNQVWTNLIDNAIDAMDKDGLLRIKAEKQGDSVEVKIVDNGTGIPEEIQSQIFDPFFSTKKLGEGTGLGLDIVKRIINNHSATIKVKSKPGETMFIICFPLLEK